MAAPTATPRGTIVFIHGANETSTGLARHLTRIHDAVDRRGWDVRVVAPEWRRRSGLRLGEWRAAIPRLGRPPTLPIPSLGAGLRKDVVQRIVTSYYEYRHEALLETIGVQLLADVIGYHRHRASIHAILREELRKAAEVADREDTGTVLPVALSLGGIVLVDLLAEWSDAPVDACVTVGSQAPLLYAFDALPGLPYDDVSPPRLPVPWLNVYDTRDFLSFVAEPLFRRRDGTASVVDLRVRSGRDFPASHSAYWDVPAVWDGIAAAFSWRRTTALTVRQARALGFEASNAAQRRRPVTPERTRS